jgi:DNA invertase Pin-like site-specific DNA recombinase
MQTDYYFHGLKGYARLKKFSYLFEMTTDEASKRYKIIKFYDKYGLEATKEAFNISRRTIYRWKAKLKNNKNEMITMIYIF